jgi:putative spermidine/putrescine transport system substrate-binding protein
MTRDDNLQDLASRLKTGRLTRRDFVLRALALGVSVSAIGTVLSACGGDDEGGGGGENVTMSFVSWGGTFQEAQTKAWLDPYAEANPNVTWVQDEPTDYAKIKAMVESGNVTWDVVDIGNDFGLSATSEALMVKLDPAVVPMDELQPDVFLTHGYRAPCHVYSTVVGYLPDKVSTPTSFADFFDLAKFPGKRGCYNYVTGGLLEMALISDGVALADLYPLDVQRAFDYIDKTIKDQIVWWDTGAQSAQLLADGEVSMGMSWSNRLVTAKEEGANIVIMWDQHILMADYLCILKGSKNVDAAMAFVGWALSADHAADLSKYIPSGPANVGAVDKIDPKYAADIPTAHMEGAVPQDDQYWADNYDTLDPVWQKWVQQ